MKLVNRLSWEIFNIYVHVFSIHVTHITKIDLNLKLLAFNSFFTRKYCDCPFCSNNIVLQTLGETMCVGVKYSCPHTKRKFSVIAS